MREINSKLATRMRESKKELHLWLLWSLIDRSGSDEDGMSVKKRYGLVVFGASGFTGQFVVKELARAADEERGEFAWAVAGRNGDKLQAMLQETAQSLGGFNRSVAV